MFPGPGAHIYYNEAGEPEGWDYPTPDDGAPPYCDQCGYNHFLGDCQYDDLEDEEMEEEDWDHIYAAEEMADAAFDERA